MGTSGSDPQETRQSAATDRQAEAINRWDMWRSIGRRRGGESAKIGGVRIHLPSSVGAAGGGADRIDQGGAQAVAFEFGQSGDGGAAGRGHHVLEHGGMFAGFEHHRGGAQHRLRGQPHGIGPRQADAHAAIGERFDDQIDVGRAAAGETGDRIHQALGHFDGQAHRAEQHAGGFRILAGGAAAEAISGGTLADQRGVLGIARMTRILSEPRLPSAASVMPAAMEMTSMGLPALAGRRRARAVGRRSGLVQRRITSQSASAEMSEATRAPVALAK